MRGFGRRGVVVRPVVVAPMGGRGGGRPRRRMGPLKFIPILVAMGIVAYLIMKNMN